VPTTSVAREPHPWNRAFRWEDHTGPFHHITAAQAQQFDRDGFFVVEDAFGDDEIGALTDELAPGEQAVRDFLAELPGGRFQVAGVDTQTVAPHQVQRSAWVQRFCAHPVLTGLCRDLVGPDVRLYWEQAVYKQPHSVEPVLWHQDNGYTYVEPQAYLTCWIALTDATPDNGCVRVLPGVHRGGTLRHRDTPIGFECFGDDALEVEVPVRAGAVVVFSSLTPHHTGLNHTDTVRRSYIVQYAPDGAVTLEGDPKSEPVRRVPQDDPDRQFLVVQHGRPLAPRRPT
jgi:phytanoyl-CoA hydroxylase